MEGLEFQNCQKIGDEKLHVVSCYAPTTTASREDKTKFQFRSDGSPTSEMYILLRDFNTSVRPREYCNDQWSNNIRGSHGYGKDDTGKELLYFLTMNKAVVCSM